MVAEGGLREKAAALTGRAVAFPDGGFGFRGGGDGAVVIGDLGFGGGGLASGWAWV